ncbi:hypothetical protein [Nocardia aurantiaca]|uniref:Uncharacterized protein n=1 Tax=Nocardia aurantiaca TaxID=2675850 RepID=A0A6I3KSX0_9NOCA|nr:hypothetical protein [Nocardia aurantiaca]MTE12617.1 hypothetical protein [Nocardia aurantiaca]
MSGGSAVCAREIMPRAGDWAPLLEPSTRHRHVVVDVDNPDPLAGVLSKLAERSTGRTALVQVIVTSQRGTRSPQPLSAHAVLLLCNLVMVSMREAAGFFISGYASRGHIARTSADMDPVAVRWQREVEAKQAARPHLRVTVRVAVAAPVPARYLRGEVDQIAAGFDPVVTGGNGLLTRRTHHARTQTTTRAAGKGFVVTVAELASLWHLPAFSRPIRRFPPARPAAGHPPHPTPPRSAMTVSNPASCDRPRPPRPRPAVCSFRCPTSPPVIVNTRRAPHCLDPHQRHRARPRPIRRLRPHPAVCSFPLPDFAFARRKRPPHPNPIQRSTGGVR